MGGVRKFLKNRKWGGVIINWGGWKSLTKYTQNLHEFERIRAIWENYSESSKMKWLVNNRNFEIDPLMGE